MSSSAAGAERFWSYVERSSPEACWEWRGCRQPDGYGVWTTTERGPGGEAVRRKHRAHRHAWTVVNGPVPAGRRVLHRCDNPPCCNPDHLYVGTAADNARDRDRPERRALLRLLRLARRGQQPLPGLDW